MCGVAGAVVMLCIVLQVLLSHYVWCCGCCCQAMWLCGHGGYAVCGVLLLLCHIMLSSQFWLLSLQLVVALW